MSLRFAPCLYDDIHIGNIFVLLANHLHAINTHSSLILRIDYKHNVLKQQEINNARMLIDKCKIYNITFDKVIYQSDRQHIYKEVMQELIRNNIVYNHLNLYYIKLNRQNMFVQFTDIVFGLKKKRIQHIQDPVIYDQHRDLFFYNFTSVVDDLTLNIKTIIRGIDHIDNTFLQISIMQLLLHILNATLPSFAHIPMCLDSDGRKISKTDMLSIFSFDKLIQHMVMYHTLVYYLFFSDRKIKDIYKLMCTFTVRKVKQSNKKIDINLIHKINNCIIKFIQDDEIVQFLSIYIDNININIIRTIKFYVDICDIKDAHNLIQNMLSGVFVYKNFITDNTHSILNDNTMREYEKVNKIFNITYGKEVLMFIPFEQMKKNLT